MGLLNKVKTKAEINGPIRAILYGVDGVGKTSFGVNSPKPIFLQTEPGVEKYDVPRLRINSYQELDATLDELLKEKHDYKSAVFDSFDWFEPHLWDFVCANAVKNKKYPDIEAFGFKKGYIYAEAQWQKLIRKFEALSTDRSMNIILLGHSEIKNFHNPENDEPYRKHQLKVHPRAASLLREWVDCCLFAKFKEDTYTRGGKTRAIIDGKERYMYSERRAEFDAKSRYTIPFELPLDWEAFEKEFRQSKTAKKNFKATAEKLIRECSDSSVKDKATEALQKAGNNQNEILRIIDKLQQYNKGDQL